MGTSSLGFNMIDLFNSFGDATMGSARSGSTSSAKAVVTSDGSISVISGTSSVESAKVEAVADTEKETKINEAPLKIQDYLLNTFDKKMTTLLTMSAGGYNYSVTGIDTSKFLGMIGSDVVTVSANDDERTNQLATITESVVDIQKILQRVISGESQMNVKLDASSLLSQTAQVSTNTLTRTIGG